MPKNFSENQTLALNLINSYQLPNGALSAGNGQTASLAASALTLLFLNQLPTDPPADQIKKNLADFLLAQKNGNWLYADNGHADLALSFCALSALAGYDQTIFDGQALALIMNTLTQQEIAPGGPYRDFNGQTDLAANLYIAYFLSFFSVRLETLDDFLTEAIASGRLESAFHASPELTAYFLSVLAPDAEIEKINNLLNIYRERNQPTENFGAWLLACWPLNASKQADWLVSINTEFRRWLGNPAKSFVCLRQVGSAEPTAIDLPFLPAAIFLNFLASAEDEPSAKSLSPAYEAVRQQVFQRVDDRFALLETDLKARALDWRNNIAENDLTSEVALLAALFRDALGGNGAAIPDSALAKLGEANVYLWITFKLYDDFLDEEGDPRTLPVANVCLRDFVQIHNRFFHIDSRYHLLFREIMDTLEGANAWEVANCRAQLSGYDLLKPEKLPDYGNYEKLCQRSLAHCLGPLALIFAAGGDANGDPEKVIAFFKNYLIARQLNDDLHDWEKDIKRGHLDSVAAAIWKKWGKDKIDLRNDSDINEMKKLFWFDIMPEIAEIALGFIDQAKQLADSIALIEDSSILKNLLAPSERSSRKALEELKQSQGFISGFTAK